MKIQTPAGETFRIHRRWLPWRRLGGQGHGLRLAAAIGAGELPPGVLERVRQMRELVNPGPRRR
jgi:hypothetical protein